MNETTGASNINDPSEDISPGSIDEQFRSLMEGLRTTLPGAQVLVAFLLVLPVQSEFGKLSDVDKGAYYLAFVTAMLASVLLIAPSVHQRVRAPMTGIKRRTKRHLDIAVWLTIIGTIALFIALVAVTFLVTSLVFSTVAAVLAALAVSLITGYTWIYQPLVAFER